MTLRVHSLQAPERLLQRHAPSSRREDLAAALDREGAVWFTSSDAPASAAGADRPQLVAAVALAPGRDWDVVVIWVFQSSLDAAAAAAAMTDELASGDWFADDIGGDLAGALSLDGTTITVRGPRTGQRDQDGGDESDDRGWDGQPVSGDALDLVRAVT